MCRTTWRTIGGSGTNKAKCDLARTGRTQQDAGMQLPPTFLGDLVATIAFGLLAIVLIAAGYKLFDKMLPNVDFNEELKKGNTAFAIVIATFLLGLCYVMASVVGVVLNLK